MEFPISLKNWYNINKFYCNMYMMVLAKCIVSIFGIFIIFAGFLMLFTPIKSRFILRKFASTVFINYFEITLRLIIGIALVYTSYFSKYPEAFSLLGKFMIITSIILYCVPRKLHHQFSNRCADFIKPIYFRFISPFAFIFGGLILYNLF